MIEIKSFNELVKKIKDKQKAYLLLYKPGSDKSDCAYKNIAAGSKGLKDIPVFYTDVTTVRNIHIQYNITSAPSLLEFENSDIKNIIKGCHDVSYFKALFEDAIYFAETKNSVTPLKRVTVYSSPTCTWCNTLKNHLKQNKVRFTDIDISRDQRAAEELVKRSGQMGVPQTDINGEIIIGFNKSKIVQPCNKRSNISPSLLML